MFLYYCNSIRGFLFCCCNQPFYGAQPGYTPNPGYTDGYPQQEAQFGQPQGPPHTEYPAGYPPQAFYQPECGYQQPGYAEVASDDIKGFAFNDQTIRKAFIRKVYSILTIQLLVTCSIIALFVLHDGTKMFIWRNPYLVLVASILTLIITIAISCCERARRQTPMNFILLALFTLAESLMLGVISASYDSVEVLMALGITSAVCLAVTIFALQTKWDFTVCGGVLLVAFVVFLLFGLIAMFIPGKVVQIIYAAFGAIMFSLYLLYDTQLMLGGKKHYTISPEDYIFAALSLYLDVINVFVYILSLVSSSRN